MTKRLAAAGAGVALAGVVTAVALTNTSSIIPETTTTETETALQVIPADVPPPAPCTLTNAAGAQVANACVQQIASWQAQFRNGLANAAYYAKWKSANPGEWSTLRAYAISPPATPQPTVRTGFGAVVRWGVEQCRIWASDMNTCALL